jgi:hypothetical protein
MYKKYLKKNCHPEMWFVQKPIDIHISFFSSAGQRPVELLPSLCVCCPSIAQILILHGNE